MKIQANHPPPNSILKPDTSSDSASAKSKGLRLDSAKILNNHPKNNGILNIITGVRICFAPTMSDDIEALNQSTIKKARLTSYETAWATHRIEPIMAQPELADHPESKIGNSPRVIIRSRASGKKDQIKVPSSEDAADTSKMHQERAPIGATK